MNQTNKISPFDSGSPAGHHMDGRANGENAKSLTVFKNRYGCIYNKKGAKTMKPLTQHDAGIIDYHLISAMLDAVGHSGTEYIIAQHIGSDDIALCPYGAGYTILCVETDEWLNDDEIQALEKLLNSIKIVKDMRNGTIKSLRMLDSLDARGER